MRRGWSCRRGQEAAAVFLFGKSGDGACGACQTEKIWYNGRRIMPRRCAAKGDAMRIFVAGAGAWGTALAMLLDENGHAVTLWTRNAEKAREIDVTRQNPALAGVTLPPGHPGDGGAGRGGERGAGALRGAELCAARDGAGHRAASAGGGHPGVRDEGHRAQHKCAHDGDHRGIRRDGAADCCALWPDACRRSLTPNGDGVCAVEPRSGGGQARPRRS